MKDKAEITKLFSLELRNKLDKLSIDFNKIYEIRLRVNQPVILVNENEEIFLSEYDEDGITRDINKELITYDTLGEMTKMFDKDYREFTKVLSYMYENNIDISSLVYIDIRYKSGSLPHSYYQVDPKSLKISFSKNVCRRRLEGNRDLEPLGSRICKSWNRDYLFSVYEADVFQPTQRGTREFE